MQFPNKKKIMTHRIVHQFFIQKMDWTVVWGVGTSTQNEINDRCNVVFVLTGHFTVMNPATSFHFSRMFGIYSHLCYCPYCWCLYFQTLRAHSTKIRYIPMPSTKKFKKKKRAHPFIHSWVVYTHYT